MNRTLTVLVVVVALVAAAAGLLTARQGEMASAPPAPNPALEKLLNLEFPDSTSSKRPLSDAKGKVLVLNFWATWCPPCRKEMPALSAMSTKYQNKGVQFFGLSIDTETNVRAYQAKYPVSYPLLITPMSAVGLTEALGNTSQALPFTVIVDKNGMISVVKLGMLSEEELDRKLAELTRS